MVVKKDATSLRKRAQISRANRMMFVYVAAASILVSASVVLSIMMVQRGIHVNKAIGRLRTTVDTLTDNNKKSEQLEDQIRALSSNEELLALRTNDTDNALRVVLDALPADPNPSAFGASLQNKLLEGVDEVESVVVMPLDEEDTSGESSGINDSGVGVIPFRVVAHGSPSKLQSLLDRLDKSIRTVGITNIKIETESRDRQKITIVGEAYYLPAAQLTLDTVEVRP